MMSRRISAAEERELISAAFAAALMILAIFLAFFGVLAAVQPQVEKITELREAFVLPVRVQYIWSDVIRLGGCHRIALSQRISNRPALDHFPGVLVDYRCCRRHPLSCANDWAMSGGKRLNGPPHV